MNKIFLEPYISFQIAIEHLLKLNVSKSTLDHVHVLLVDFVKHVSEMYPKQLMLSGMHEHLHLVETTKHFGPINTLNCFLYEELNRKTNNLTYGKSMIGEEFIKLFRVVQSLHQITYNKNNVKYNFN